MLRRRPLTSCSRPFLPWGTCPTRSVWVGCRHFLCYVLRRWLSDGWCRCSSLDVRHTIFQYLFGLPFRFAVVVERIFWMVLVRILFVKSIDSHGWKEDDAPAAVLFHSPECHFHTADIRIVIKRYGRYVVAVLRGKEDYDISSFELAVHLGLLADITDNRDVIEKWLGRRSMFLHS